MEDLKVSKTFYLGKVATIPSTLLTVLLSGAHRLADRAGGRAGDLLLVLGTEDKSVFGGSGQWK